jgi:hypothetical protein
MSTRAIYTFKGFGETYHVYVHHDGYPTGAAGYFAHTLEGGKIWKLPRYEPDEFAAGFVASVKVAGGGVRLAANRRSMSDVEYGYTVEPDKTIPSLMRITVHACNFWGDKPKEKKLWSGPLMDFIFNAAAIQEQLEEA